MSLETKIASIKKLKDTYCLPEGISPWLVQSVLAGLGIGDDFGIICDDLRHSQPDIASATHEATYAWLKEELGLD